MSYQFEPPDHLRGMQQLTEETEQWASRFEMSLAPKKQDDKVTRRRMTVVTLFVVVTAMILVAVGVVQISYIQRQSMSLDQLTQSISRLSTDLEQVQTMMTEFTSRTAGPDMDALSQEEQTDFPTAQPDAIAEVSGQLEDVARSLDDVIGALLDTTTRENELRNSTDRLTDILDWMNKTTTERANFASVHSQLLTTQGGILRNLTQTAGLIFTNTETQMNELGTVQNRMDTFVDKLTQLETEMKSSSAQQSANDSTSTDMELKVTSIFESVNNLSIAQKFDISQVLNSTSSLVNILLNTENNIADLRQQNNGVRSDMDFLNSKMDNILANTINLTSGVADITTQADNITAISLGIDIKQYDVLSILTDEQLALSTMHDVLNEINSSTDVQKSALLNLTSIISTLSGNSADINAGVNSSSTRMNQLVTTTNALQAAMQTLANKSDQLDNKLDQILGSTNIGNLVDIMATQINTSTSAVAEILQSVGSLRRSLENATVALFAPPPSTTTAVDIYNGSANGLVYFTDYLSERFHRRITEASLSVGVLIGNKNLRKCLSVRSGDNKIQVRDCQYGSATSNQIWTMDSTGRLHSRPTDKCLDVQGLRPQNDGKQLYSYMCSAQDDHFWQFEYSDCGNYVQIKNRDTGKCVGVTSAGLAQQFTCHTSCTVENSKQFWVIIPV